MTENNNWTEMVDQIKQVFHVPVNRKTDHNALLLAELLEAQKEWGYAKQYFNTVTDPDLVDLAIYYMGVAEKKYIYLLKKARENGTCIERYNLH